MQLPMIWPTIVMRWLVVGSVLPNTVGWGCSLRALLIQCYLALSGYFIHIFTCPANFFTLFFVRIANTIYSRRTSWNTHWRRQSSPIIAFLYIVSVQNNDHFNMSDFLHSGLISFRLADQLWECIVLFLCFSIFFCVLDLLTFRIL